MLRYRAFVPAPRPALGTIWQARRTFLSRSRQRPSGRAIENLNLRTLNQDYRDYHQHRQSFLMAGAVAGAIAFIFTAWKLKGQLAKNPTRQDSGLPPTGPLLSGGAGRKVVIHDGQGREIVPTGNSVVPEFPRIIELPLYSTQSSADIAGAVASTDDLTLQSEEYTLVGLGLRTVSFLGLQVYVVGYYVATADVAAWQTALVKKINPIATTLVPEERDQLRAQLLDPIEGENTWDGLLKEGLPARSVFRVVPVRDTDFHHLRDGFVRAIQARSSKWVSNAEKPAPGGDDDFGKSVRQFRMLFNRGSLPKGKELLLVRDSQGRLSIMYDDGGNKKEGHRAGRQLVGTVDDERISRTLWLNYLAGKKVASEPARQSIVEGVMEFVERPVGTVASQVVAVLP